MEYILKNALLRRTLDNVTVVIVAFENFDRICFGTQENEGLSDSKIVKNRNPQNNNTHTSGQF